MHQPTQTGSRKARPLPRLRRVSLAPWIFLILLLAAAAASGAYYYFVYGSVASAEVALVKRGTALAGVYGTVDVQPVNQAIVRIRSFGLLSSVKVKEGDQVKDGEILAELEDQDLQRQLQTQDAALADARTRQTLGPPSNAALQNQEIEVDKLQKLFDANNIAVVELEKAKNDLKQLREQNQSELMNLKNDVQNLSRARDGTEDQLANLKLKAPMDGVVLDLYAHLGEFLAPETQFCRVGSAENEVVANINEEDVGYLQPGMKAHIRLYAHQDKDLVGTLKEILPQAENQVYRVRFSLDNPPAVLLPGMTGEMNIIIGQRENTLTIPSRAVRRGGIVLAVINGIVQQIPIQIGFHTLERTEVLQGLAEGTPVILTNQDLFKPGVRVRQLIVKSE